MKLTPVKKFFLTGIGTALALAAVIAAYAWVYGRIADSTLALQRSDADIASRRKEQEQAGDLKTLLREHRGDFDRMRALSVSRANPAAFLKKFESIAAAARTAITIDLDNREIAADTLAFRFAVEGAEENVLAVLKLIETAPYELTIDDLSIQYAEDSAKTRLRVGIRVKASP